MVEGDVLPHSTTVAVSGAPIQRLTTVDGTEVHRCAISNCEFFELLYPLSYMEFGMKNKLDIDAESYARPPQQPGIGVDFDWDLIDHCTVQKW